MSFAFGFSGDDIADDCACPDELAAKLEGTNITPIPQAATLFAPRRHTLAGLLRSIPSQVSYNYLDVPVLSAQDGTTGNGNGNGNDNDGARIRVPRREIHDIRQQLMAEVDLEDSETEASATDSLSLLEGLARGDLSTGVYEGGFKTWECAVDLAGFVSSHMGRGRMGERAQWHVVELGAGSAIPSLVLLQRVVRERVGLGGKESGRSRGSTLEDSEGDAEEGHVEVDEDLVGKALKVLEDANIEIDFISGAWGEDFLHLLYGHGQTSQYMSRPLSDQSQTLVLASETIYAPSSLGVFSNLLYDMLNEERRMAPGRAEAFVAAKKVYFGVGGGVAEFEEEIKKLGGMSKTVLDVKGAGVGRVVLEISTT
ncbi:hypothetical protein LTR70_005044 [Exophiala xenobiotica]|uniref:protein-histidine N-methyltransferase n=1 Tax=Lithohypha guttulata TaxID=1690604 RepID=A0ABR0K8Y5_9EURO|nr:hypothetical protein LTR24_005520 [Lithohypha guttulata]KAK5319291.1 hypothetical protein LTR70_005044 [Exophiala xenobiotica]